MRRCKGRFNVIHLDSTFERITVAEELRSEAEGGAPGGPTSPRRCWSDRLIDPRGLGLFVLGCIVGAGCRLSELLLATRARSVAHDGVDYDKAEDHDASKPNPDGNVRSRVDRQTLCCRRRRYRRDQE
jgi:hypothetical protein